MISAILMGRKGSTGFPGKNVLPVLGRPLCEYPILAAKHSNFIDKIFVSTDDEQIMEISRQHGAEVIMRPEALATKEALGEDVYRHALDVIKYEYLKGDQLELVVLIMCNAATILAETIDVGIKVLQQRPEIDSAVTVSCYNMWSPLRARKIDADGLLQPFVPFETFGDPNKLNCDRDSQGDVWFADMGVSVIRPENLYHLENGLLPQKWMGKEIYPLKQWGGCDVDYEWQVAGVEYWLKEHGFSFHKTPYL